MKKLSCLILILFFSLSSISLFSQKVSKSKKITIPKGYHYSKQYNYYVRKPNGWKELNQNKYLKIFIKNSEKKITSRLIITSFLSVPVPDKSQQNNFIEKMSEQLRKIKGGKLLSYKFFKDRGMFSLKANSVFSLEKLDKKPLKKAVKFHQIFQIFYVKGNQYSIIGAFPENEYKDSIKAFNLLTSTFKCTQAHVSKEKKKVSFLSSYLPILIIFFFVIIGFFFLKNRKPKF